MIDHYMAHQFLSALGRDRFIFQTFTDSKSAEVRESWTVTREGKQCDPLRRVLKGSYKKHKNELDALSKQGAGVFIQLNDSKARGIKGVQTITALFIDLDYPDTTAQSLASLQEFMPQPSIITQSSPGKYHIYWRVEDCPLDQFKRLQTSLAVRFGGDTQVSNLDRCMRVPGYPHQKYAMAAVTCTVTSSGYTTHELIQAAGRATDIFVERPGKKVAAQVAVSTNAFGIDVSSYEMPDELVPGTRTGELVSMGGHLIAKGYSEDHVRQALIKANVELCKKGEDPIPDDVLEAEVLGAVNRFANNRLAETHHTAPPPPDIPNAALPAPPPPPIQRTSGVKPDTNAEVHSLDAWLGRFLFIEEGGCVADRTRAGMHAIYKPDEFKRKYSNVYANEKTKLHTNWLNHPHRQDVRCDVYVPNDEEIIYAEGVKMWNRYKACEISPSIAVEPSLIAPFFEHIDILFPTADSADLFLDWMAMTITKPEVRIPWAPVLISDEGYGKGLLYQIMSRLMGEHNCSMIMPDRLDSQFNSFMANSTLVCIDEMKPSTKFGAADKLRNLITDIYLEINEKQQRERMRRVYANILIFSNRTHATYLTATDRRYWIHRILEKASFEHFEMMFAWIESDTNISHLLRWVHDRDISQFKFARTPPMTEAKLEMIESSKSHIEIIIEDAIDIRDGPFAADVIGYPTVQSYVSGAMDVVSMDKYDAMLRAAWNKYSYALPASTSRVSIKKCAIKQMRVRCVRNVKRWTAANRENVAYEAQRALQMQLTPNDVAEPLLREV